MFTLFAQWFRGLLSKSGTARAGAWGERRAARWLQRERGFTVIARNWRNPRDRRQEIDLVCRDGDVLVFVEVKARAAEALVGGYFAVDRRKRRVLRRVVAAYLRRLRVRPHTFRFDVVEVTLSSFGRDWLGGRRTEVRHFENIPLFSKHFRP